jgi:hypothetical protein
MLHPSCALLYSPWGECVQNSPRGSARSGRSKSRKDQEEYDNEFAQPYEQVDWDHPAPNLTK